MQAQLSKNIKEDVKANESDSSLALSLDHKKVQEEIEKYSQQLADLVKDKQDVIGYVFAINGKFISADVYGSHQLFCKVWPRLLRANAIEAVAELDVKKFDSPTVAGCRRFMEDTERFTAEMARAGDARTGELQIYQRGTRSEPTPLAKKLSAQDEGKSLLFESADKQHGMLRRNILAR